MGMPVRALGVEGGGLHPQTCRLHYQAPRFLMTLIITALSDDAVVQVSDRRLTYPNGRIYSETANKSLCVECSDTVFTVAYTGLALIGTVLTDRWIVNYLRRSGAVNKRFPDLLADFHAEVKNTFTTLRNRGLGNARRITFVFAGFGPPGPFVAYLTNQEDESGRSLRRINDEFLRGGFLRNDRPMRKLDVWINGAENAITPDLKTAIAQVRRRYLRLPPEQRASVFVDVLRRASLHRTRGWPIGRNCMSTVQRAAGGWLSQYHPEHDEPFSYMPHYVGRHFLARDIWIRPG